MARASFMILRRVLYFLPFAEYGGSLSSAVQALIEELAIYLAFYEDAAHRHDSLLMSVPDSLLNDYGCLYILLPCTEKDCQTVDREFLKDN